MQKKLKQEKNISTQWHLEQKRLLARDDITNSHIEVVIRHIIEKNIKHK